MASIIKNIFFKDNKITTFHITRLHKSQVEEKVLLKKNKQTIDITANHSMICLDPFCVSVWLTHDEVKALDVQTVKIEFVKGATLNASIKVALIEKITTEKGVLLLYKIKAVKNYQLNFLHRLVFFAYFLRSKKNTYYSRRVISALYSYPRNIIIVSYMDAGYYNLFPMDIQGYIEQEGLYILGLRTTNVTLNKILETKKVVVCDTDTVDIDTVYNLGKHSSTAPTPIETLPFGTNKSEVFGFPVPDFVGSYKEIEIIKHKKMGYHMLLVGKVVNTKQLKETPSSLYHVGFLQFKNGNYISIDGLF